MSGVTPVGNGAMQEGKKSCKLRYSRELSNGKFVSNSDIHKLRPTFDVLSR